MAPSASAYSITVNSPYSGAYFAVDAFCVIGAANSAPFDPGALPAFTSNLTSGTNTTAGTSISTTNADTFIFSFAVSGNYSNCTSWTPDSGTGTTIDTSYNGGGSYQCGTHTAYSTYTSAQSGLTCGFTNSASDWALMVDAITADSGGLPTLPIPSDDTASGANNTQNQYSSSSSGSLPTLSITPSVAGELILILVGFYSGSSTVGVSSVSATGLTFTQRARKVSSADPNSQYFIVEEWYATGAGTGANTITVSWANASGQTYIFATGTCIEGANATNPFDPNSGLPVFATNVTASAASLQTTMSTTNADDIILVVGYEQNTGGPSWIPLAGDEATIASGNLTPGSYSFTFQLAYGQAMAPQSGATVGFNNSVADWVLFVDAISANSPAVAAPPPRNPRLIVPQFRASYY